MLEDIVYGKLLFEQFPMRIAVVSVPEYRYEMANPAQTRFYESLGVKDFIGRRYADLWQPNKFMATMDEVCRTGHPQSIVDEPVDVASAGKPVYSSCYYFPIFEPDGTLGHIMWAAGDTTEQVERTKAEVQARSQVEQEAERQRKAMEEQLRALSLLHTISAKLTVNADLDDVLSAILDAAVRISHADGGSIRVRGESGSVLRVVAFLGFEDAFRNGFPTVQCGSPSSCGQAWKLRERVVIEDVETWEGLAGSREAELYRQAGIRAVQSTPVLSSSGEVVAMLSTHHRNPVRFGTYELQLVDMLARLVGAVVEWNRLDRERRETQLRAEQRAAEWSALINASHDAIFVTDERGRVLDGNATFLRFLGFPDGTPVASITEYPRVNVYTTDGRLLDRQERPVERALRGETVVNYPCRLVNSHGEEREILQNVTAVETPLGTRVLSISTNITELRRLERLKDEFMLVIGHELRNPLQVILGQAQLMSLKMPPELRPAMGPSLDSLTAQARLLNTLVDDLLNAYRAGNGRLAVSMGKVDFRTIVLGTLEPHLSGRDHIWSVSAVKSRLRISADPQRLGQAIANLLTNAQKYTPAGGHIWVRLYTRKGSAVLSVEDDGPGIPPQDLDRVFEGFYRTPEVAKWQSGGIGLGLFISRSLVRRMGGDLWAENRPGGGTIMKVRMPLIGK